MVVLPRPIVQRALDGQLPIALLPSDAGYFPRAAGHYIERPHGCGQLILILCVRGSGWAGIGGFDYAVSPGELITILPNEPHWYGTAEDHPWTIYWCHAAGEAAERLGSMLQDCGSTPVLEVDDQPRLVGLFEEIANELAKGYGIDHLLPASMALAHLLGLAIAGRRRHNAPADAVLRVQQAIGYMQQRHDERIDIPELAATVNLSTSHFCAVFKKVAGFSPLDYFLRLKVRRGCELLDGTSFPVKRISEQLGFSDPLYFSRVFRRICGMSPMAYRKIIKG
jgi:AraC-like DNA-binding protein